MQALISLSQLLFWLLFFVFQFVFIYISFFFLLLAKPFLYSSSHFIVLFSDHLPLLFLSYFVFFVLCLSSFF